MSSRHFMFVCTSLLYCSLAVILTKNVSADASRTRFACYGRPPGYYADMETGCQVYHMCDALGRQFSYTCPNTTLFQQRMLVCDHWYMVNCSKSERDYGANLLIGQRDKPFVSEEEMRLRTPRPDILSVPPNNNYYDGLKEAESKYPVLPGNSIVGVPDTISSVNNNGLDSAKNQYRPPTSWSTGSGNKRPTAEHQNTQSSQNQGFTNQGQGQRPVGNQGFNNQGQFGGQNIQRPNVDPNGQNQQNSEFAGNGQSQSFGQGFLGANNQDTSRPSTSNQNTHNLQTSQSNNGFNQVFGGHNSQRPNQSNNNPSFNNQNQGIGSHDNYPGAGSQVPNPTQATTDFTHNNGVPQPSFDLTPPFSPKPTTTEVPSSEEYDLDIRMKNSSDPVVNFINRFDPNSPTAHKTSMTASEIFNINQQLPQGHEVSAEDKRTPRKNKNGGTNFNALETEKKGMTVQNRFNTVNVKPSFPTTPTPRTVANNFFAEPQNPGFPQPSVNLLPPKTEYSEPPSTTMGPPIYYEWKWAVPAFDLEAPKISNETYNINAPTGRNAQGKRPYSDVTRPSPTTEDVTPSNFNTEYNISSYFVPDYIFPLDKPHPSYENDDAQTSFQVNAPRPGRSSYGENPACPQCHPAYVRPGTCEPCIIER